MVVQFVAMLVHRFGTFSQIITKTRLNFDLFNKSIDEMTIDELKARDPLQIAKESTKTERNQQRKRRRGGPTC
jgi:hypothetical protein